MEEHVPMTNTKTQEFQRGWPIILAAATGIGLGLSPLPFYTIDVMVGPLGAEFGWSRGDVFSAVAIYTIGAFLAAPLIGMLSERYGARRVSLISIVTFGISLMMLSLNTGDKVLYFVLWFFMALAGVGTLPITFTRPINNWFSKSRGLALGLALITTGIFGALAKFFTQYMVDWVGWRGGYIALGFLPIVIALPIALLGVRDIDDIPPKDALITKFKVPLLLVALVGVAGLVYGAFSYFYPLIAERGFRLEYVMAFFYIAVVILIPLALLVGNIRTSPLQADGGQQKRVLPGLSLKEAARTWRFWLLAVCFIPISYALGAIIPSLVPMLMAKGYAIGDALSLATLTSLAVLSGRLVGGYLIDRYWAPGVAFLFLASPTIAFYLLTGNLTPDTATLAILMIGFGAGVEYDFMAYLVSKYFGMRSYSAIYGAIYGFFAIGAGFGPAIMNNLADSRGWDTTLLMAGGVLFVFTLPLLALGAYQYDHEE